MTFQARPPDPACRCAGRLGRPAQRPQARLSRPHRHGDVPGRIRSGHDDHVKEAGRRAALNIGIDPATIARTLGEEGVAQSADLMTDLTLDDLTVLHLARPMWRELESGGLLGDLYLSRQHRATADPDLIRRRAASDPIPNNRGGGLDERRLR